MKICSIIICVLTTLIIIGIGIGLGVYFYLKYVVNQNDNVSTTRRTTLFTGSVPISTNCGVSQIAPSIDGKSINRIINGQEAVANSWPWVVSLRKVSSTGQFSTHFCGGSLFNAIYVITAAHCLAGLSPNQIAVVIGVSDFQNSVSSSNIYLVSDLIIHPDYDAVKIVNDIGIIKLRRSVTLTNKIQNICLPSSSGDATKVYQKNLVLTGWGSVDGIDSSTHLSSKLKQTTLKVLNGAGVCAYKLISEYDANKVYCAYDSKGSNACFGDSGGPLMYYENNRWYLYGIVSYVKIYSSNQQCDPSQPSFYTQVAAYLQWAGNAIANLN